MNAAAPQGKQKKLIPFSVNVAIMSQSAVYPRKLRKNTKKINIHLQVLFPVEIYHIPTLHYSQIH